MTVAKKTAKKTTTTPAKKPAARATPKVSPLRGMPIAEWVEAKTSGWQKTVVTRLLRLVKRAAPEATVSIKWGQPVFEHCGPMAFIKPAKAHITFGFWRGAELTDEAGVLEGGERMKHVKIASTEDLHEVALEAFVREASALNASKGDPTRVQGSRTRFLAALAKVPDVEAVPGDTLDSPSPKKRAQASKRASRKAG